MHVKKQQNGRTRWETMKVASEGSETKDSAVGAQAGPSAYCNVPIENQSPSNEAKTPKRGHSAMD